MPIIRILPPGSASNFKRNSAGKALGLNGDLLAVIPLVMQPVEVLSSSAVISACSQTAFDEILAWFILPANTLGPNSILQIEPLWTFTNNANSKVVKIKIGGTTVYTATRTTSLKESPLIVLANRNSLTSQIQPYETNYLTAGTVVPVTYTIDFSKDLLVQVIGRQVALVDSLRLEYYRVLHFVGA